MEPPLPKLVFVVVDQISPNDPGIGQNLNVPVLFILQCFLIALVGEKQAHPVALITHRGIVGQNMEDNHVPGVFIEPGQVHVVMPLVILGTGPNPGFLHPLGNGFSVTHGDTCFDPAP